MPIRFPLSLIALLAVSASSWSCQSRSSLGEREAPATRAGAPAAAPEPSPFFALHEVAEVPTDGFQAIESGDGTLFISDQPLITNRHVSTARAVETPDGPALVELVWTPDGRRRFATATREHLGQPLALLIDERVATVLVFDEPIDESSVRMQKGESGTLAEAEAFASRFRAP